MFVSFSREATHEQDAGSDRRPTPRSSITWRAASMATVSLRSRVPSKCLIPALSRRVKMATFNARAETVETKPFFRDAFKRTRCLIPVSGYYEWQDTPGGKQPWYFTARDGSPALTVAGLWDEWRDRVSGEPLKSCTMILTKPNKF